MNFLLSCVSLNLINRMITFYGKNKSAAVKSCAAVIMK
jgi:hypothetical protein